MTHIPDWERLQKALTVEAESGFKDLQGKQYRFSEFLTLTLGKQITLGTFDQRRRWRQMAIDFSRYPSLDGHQRQQLLEIARAFFQELQQVPLPKQVPALQATSLRAQEVVVEDWTEDLDRSLTKIPELVKIGYPPLLHSLHLYTVRHLLFYYPRDHINYARQVNIKDLTGGETVTLIGTIKTCTCFTSPKNSKLTMIEINLRDDTGKIKINRYFHGAYFSNRGWQKKQESNYPIGAIAAASGLVKKSKYGLSLQNATVEVLDRPGSPINSIKIGRIIPVYPLTEGVGADQVRHAILKVLPAAQHLQDPLPRELKNQYALIDLPEAISQIHYPENETSLMHARRRLVFDEFFYLQLGFLQRRYELKQNHRSAIFAPEGKLIEQFKALLPFELTNAQKRVISEILEDLSSEAPMNRLVQGDVGSGKTVIAVFAILAAIQAGYQVAFMAPTEVLAEQHYRKLVSWFNVLYLPVELLVGGAGVRKRRQIDSQLASGELQILVGTHALIEDKVQFRNLGLVIIDEQHRFGVKQRARLLAKGTSPHVLTMTATPIPRTLSLTLHGDLDVSQVDELPPGRQPIQTTALSAKQRQIAYDLIRREVASGRQAYIVFPAIEASEKLEIKAAVKEFDRLQETIFPEFKLTLLHGRMTSGQKEQALTEFRENEAAIIVATTVIEVGVDVPNATVMLVENAERFGLAQLHQLRGRVGRGAHQSYCLLMSSSSGNDARQRLRVLEQSQDGFFISEMDLRLRGPGEFLGQKQSGMADFALANLVEDQDMLILAREAGEKIMLADPNLLEKPLLREELDRRYKRLMGGAIMT